MENDRTVRADVQVESRSGDQAQRDSDQDRRARDERDPRYDPRAPYDARYGYGAAPYANPYYGNPYFMPFNFFPLAAFGAPYGLGPGTGAYYYGGFARALADGLRAYSQEIDPMSIYQPGLANGHVRGALNGYAAFWESFAGTTRRMVDMAGMPPPYAPGSMYSDRRYYGAPPSESGREGQRGTEPRPAQQYTGYPYYPGYSYYSQPEPAREQRGEIDYDLLARKVADEMTRRQEAKHVITSAT
jgi:hypothetical protein